MTPEHMLVDRMLRCTEDGLPAGECIAAAFASRGYVIPKDIGEQYALAVTLRAGTPLRIGDVAFLVDGAGRPFSVCLYTGGGYCVEPRRKPHKARRVRVSALKRGRVRFARFTKDSIGNDVILTSELHPDDKFYYWILSVADGQSGNKLKELAASLDVPLVFKRTDRTSELVINDKLQTL